MFFHFEPRLLKISPTLNLSLSLSLDQMSLWLPHKNDVHQSVLNLASGLVNHSQTTSFTNNKWHHHLITKHLIYLLSASLTYWQSVSFSSVILMVVVLFYIANMIAMNLGMGSNIIKSLGKFAMMQDSLTPLTPLSILHSIPGTQFYHLYGHLCLKLLPLLS